MKNEVFSEKGGLAIDLFETWIPTAAVQHSELTVMWYTILNIWPEALTSMSMVYRKRGSAGFSMLSFRRYFYWWSNYHYQFHDRRIWLWMKLRSSDTLSHAVRWATQFSLCLDHLLLWPPNVRGTFSRDHHWTRLSVLCREINPMLVYPLRHRHQLTDALFLIMKWSSRLASRSLKPVLPGRRM